MPSKKKKYNSRFPPARIKKIMQTDEDIGKVAAAVPVLISKCLEMFLASLLTKAGDVTKSKRAKTMSRIHLKECIMTEPIFDFLKDHVAHIPDIQGDEEAQGSTNIPMEFDNQTKVVRKRSLPKPKRTPKKRAKLGHENESDESDAPEDSNENGSGNEGSEGPVTSSSLVSPAVLRKLESQRSLPLGAIEGGIPEKKSSIHIPLDMLMSGEEVPTSVSIEKDMVIAEDSEDTKSQGPQTSVLDNKSKVSPNIDTQNSPVRKGVIVPNTSAHPVPSRSSSHPVSRRLAVNTDSSPSTSAQGESSGSMDKKDRKELEQPAPPSSKPLQEGIPGIDHHPGSMLSLLYSSSVPSGMSLSPLPGTSTVQQASVPSQEKYAYSPLTQLQYSESKQPLLYPSAPPATNGNQGPSYQFPPYVPRPTQRHYLGYPQTILTPSGQPMSSTNAQMAMHSAMAQVKPKSRIRSDDDDYDV